MIDITYIFILLLLAFYIAFPYHLHSTFLVRFEIDYLLILFSPYVTLTLTTLPHYQHDY